jgi:glycosyltransferase involved in cell wall biosynthesis
MQYVAVSELRARQTINLLQLPPERCRIIPNGIDPAVTLNLTGRVAAFARRHRLLERDVVLFQPARVLRRKNVELGLQVTSALRSAGRDCAYVATAPPDAQNAASAEYAASIKRLRAELSLESDTLFVDEHFSATERDVASLYALADALFFPSRQEGFGLPLLEAALHRLPIFCPAIEPLCSLLDQGVSLFSPDAAPTHIAGQVMRHLDGCGAMQSRKAVVRRHAWPAIYRNFLAPLLAETNTSLRP